MHNKRYEPLFISVKEQFIHLHRYVLPYLWDTERFVENGYL